MWRVLQHYVKRIVRAFNRGQELPHDIVLNVSYIVFQKQSRIEKVVFVTPTHLNYDKVRYLCTDICLTGKF